MGTNNIQHSTSNAQPTNSSPPGIRRSMLNVECSMCAFRRWLSLFLVILILGTLTASAQTNSATTGFGPISITLGSQNGTADVDSGIKILFFITLVSLAPSLLLLMTCFTRVVIVLSFVRSALQLQGTPANQIIIGLSLFITYFVMAPVWDNINHDAIAPYEAHQITSAQAMDRASAQIRAFMLKQTRPKDVELFVAMAKMQPTAPDQLPLRVVTPAFIISELRTAFQMGFLIFVPFILIDLVVATVLMSMGMMMMPPMTISLPLKLLLFVLVDGWSLVVESLVRSFGM
ncbi:MAG TPA: flagellar type III secretion system pore protein FliP [Candidatus Sulfopaludibacter sp.]|nr:flagellar type III secretion system pore protein FliP [Candidatus Sulfopaludibacter sp.]